jgi:hypothetical protein
MRILEGVRRAIPGSVLSLLALLLLCAGCRTSTTSLFTASGPGWHIQEGQAIWRPRKNIPELAVDLLLATNNQGCSFIQFAKTPMVMASAQTTPTQWLVQFPPANMSFKGHRLSQRFLMLHLPRALANEPLPSAYRFERKPDDGWRLENTRTGETLEGFLAP